MNPSRFSTSAAPGVVSRHIQGSINIPLGELPDRFEELSRDAHVATICEGGYRSSLAASLLAREGYLHVLNVAGGMAAYREQETL